MQSTLHQKIACEGVTRQVHSEPGQGNPLWDFFQAHQGRIIHKWHHYFDIYHNHFQRYRNTNVRVLEIGLFKGGSLDMWKWYFGLCAKIFGIDIDPSCKRFADQRTQIFTGDQADRKFLKEVRKAVGKVDILIDDGGHTMEQQIATFEELYDLVAEDGIYFIEDLHTSYWKEYGGGHKKDGTFIELAKNLVDSINAWHSREPDFLPDRFTRSVGGLHFYDSVLAIEKSRRSIPPAATQKGALSHERIE